MLGQVYAYFLGNKTVIHDLATTNSYSLQVLLTYFLLMNTAVLIPDDVLDDLPQVT